MKIRQWVDIEEELTAYLLDMTTIGLPLIFAEINESRDKASADTAEFAREDGNEDEGD